MIWVEAEVCDNHQCYARGRMGHIAKFFQIRFEHKEDDPYNDDRQQHGGVRVWQDWGRSSWKQRTSVLVLWRRKNEFERRKWLRTHEGVKSKLNSLSHIIWWKYTMWKFWFILKFFLKFFFQSRSIAMKLGLMLIKNMSEKVELPNVQIEVIETLPQSIELSIDKYNEKHGIWTCTFVDQRWKSMCLLWLYVTSSIHYE